MGGRGRRVSDKKRNGGVKALITFDFLGLGAVGVGRGGMVDFGKEGARVSGGRWRTREGRGVEEREKSRQSGGA